MMAPRPVLVVSQAANSLRLQKKHSPHEIVNGTTTRSPFCTRVHAPADLLDDAHEFVAEDVAVSIIGILPR